MPKHIAPQALANPIFPRPGASGCIAARTFLGAAILATLASSGCAYCKSPVGENVVAARQLSLKGLEAMQRQEWENAEGLFAEAVRTSPVDERARWRYAETLWRRGAQKEALEQMEEAVRLSGNDPKLLVELGEMHLASGDLPRAARRAEQAVASDSRSPAAWALRGDVLRWAGNQQEALAAYHRALNYQEHFPHVQLAAAEIYGESGRPQRALATLEHLEGQFPPGQEPAEVQFAKGLALKSLGRFDEAAESLAAAARHGEPTADLLVHLSEAHLLAGDPGSAGLAINEALSREPNHPAGRELQGQIESRRQQMAAAILP